MKDEIEVSPYGDMLIYKKNYTPVLVKEIIDEHKLKGLRIFDHLDKLNSLNFLKNYNFLERLDIDCIDDQDYSFLKELPNLKYLGIGISVKEKNFIDLSNQRNLKKLSIQWRKGKITGLEKCTELTSLCLVDFKEKDFSPIHHLKNLIELEVKTASIETTNGLENLENLESLLIANCGRLKSIKNINGLKKLSLLNIEACSKIEDYIELKILPNLFKLSIINCKNLASINFIKNFNSLRELSLLGNTTIVDGDLRPALPIEKVVYSPKKHYNIKIENKKQDELMKANLKKIKESFNKAH